MILPHFVLLLAYISSVLCISFSVKSPLFHAYKALDDLTFHTSCTFSVSIHRISLSVPDIDENWNTPRTLLLQDICTFCSLCLGCLYPEYSHGLFPSFQDFYSNVIFSLRSSLTHYIKLHPSIALSIAFLCFIFPLYTTGYLMLSMFYFNYLLYYMLLSLECKLVERRDGCFIHCYIPCSSKNLYCMMGTW